MKRIISIILTMCMLLCLAPLAFAESDTRGDLNWTLDDKGTLTITGEGELVSKGLPPIQYPWDNNKDAIRNVVIGEGVTYIGSAFKNCKNLVSASLPSTATGLEGTFAGCSSLKSIVVPQNVKVLRDAFDRCSSLENVVLPEGLEEISFSCFMGCSSLKSIYIPDTVTLLGEAAFNSCTSLEYVKIGSGITEIPGVCFADCGNISRVFLPASVERVGFAAFRGCTETVFYYGGTLEQIETLEIDEDNDDFLNAMVYITTLGINLNDLALASPYFEAIFWAAGEGVTTGFQNADGSYSFRTGDKCTRGQAVTFLWRAAGSPAPETTVNPFNDVSESSPYYKAILWASENGIVNGYEGGRFAPNNTCTRAHVVTFLWRAEGRPAAQGSASFTDIAGLNADFAAAVKWAAGEGITTGYSDNTFRPNAICNRGQIVTFIYRDLVA